MNESMCNRFLVHRTLKKLKVDGSKVKNVNDAYEAVIKLPINPDVSFIKIWNSGKDDVSLDW